MLTGSKDNTARLWDVKTGKELRRFEGHSSSVNSVAFSSDGSRILTGSRDKTARLWDVKTGKELRRFEGHTSSVSSVAYSPNGQKVLTGSEDKTARLWDVETGKELRRFEGHSREGEPSTVYSVDFGGIGKRGAHWRPGRTTKQGAPMTENNGRETGRSPFQHL